MKEPNERVKYACEFFRFLSLSVVSMLNCMMSFWQTYGVIRGLFGFDVYFKVKMVANSSSDYADVNITVAMMTVDSYRKLQVILSLYVYPAVSWIAFISW